MPKKKELEINSKYERSKNTQVFKDVMEHYHTSWDDLVEPQIEGWREKESMLLGRTYDSTTGIETNSGVYDPRVATIALERAGRVMAQNPSGKSLAMSGDDRGKNMLMNMLVDKWIIPNANSQYSFLVKSRLLDLYSLVYGTMFTLVDRVQKDTYQGADFWLLPIRHCRPQPGKFSVGESDYFGVSTWVDLSWLKKRNKDTWKNIDELLLAMKDSPSSSPGDTDSNERSLIEQDRQPTVSKDKDFKKVEIYTEYRKGEWITIAPDFAGVGCLRNIGNPHQDDSLPIVSKNAFPLMDSIYGLGEFERGKTLQFALNSLWNLYLDGVKMSIFPPIQMVADDIVPSTIKMEPAAKWLLTKTGARIETFNTSPQGINTFQSTYNFLLGAIMNMAGTTDTTISATTDTTMGKTPQALRLQASREGTRDSWDRFMMEDTMQSIMTKFVNLTATGIDKEVEVRLFAKEIEDIASVAPDVVEMFEGAQRGTVRIHKDTFKDTKFDYMIEKGSTYQADQQQEQENIINLLNFTLQNYDKLQPAMAQKNKAIDLGELYQRSIITSGISDWDKIVIDAPQVPQMEPQVTGMEPQVPQMEPQVPQTGPLAQGYSDPQIAEFAQQFLGNQNGQ